jgi:heme/copper-type cytochrome/quinol oxidase subunit 1
VGGVLLATAPLNAHLHETYWVVGHIHLVLFGGSLLGLVGALFVLGGEYLRRSPGRGLMLAHLALSVPLLLVAFGLMHWLGYQGLGRRMYQVPDLPGLLGVRAANRAVTLAAMALVLVQGILLVALVDGMGWIRLWMSILWVRMTAVVATGHVLGGCVILWRDGWSLWIVGAIGIGCLVGAWTAWRVAPDGSPVNFVPIVGDKSEAVAYGRG